MSAIYVSHFTPKTVTIPAPTVPLSPGTPGLGASHYGTPAEARTAAYRYALVDVNGQLSPWSDAITIKHPAGGGVAARPCDFVPDHPEACSMLWAIDDRVGISCEGGDGPDRFGLPPFCPISPNLLTDLRKTGEALPPAGTSTILVDKPPLPQFIPFTVPNADLEWMYVFVTEAGETDASPSVVSSGDARLNKAGVGFRRFNLPGMILPPGVVAYRIYGRTLGGTWRRVGEYPIDCMQPVVYQWPARAAQPAPVASPSSMLSPLQQALSARRGSDVVVVDQDTTTAVPVIDEFGPYRSKVMGLHGANWTLNYTGGGEVGLLCQSSYSTWEDMTLTGGCKATSNWAGGQAFGCIYRGCRFAKGIRTLNTSSAWEGNHTESESLYDDCKFEGDVPIRLEGIQTCNIRFRRTHANSNPERKRGTCCIWLDRATRVVFEGGLYADQGHAIFYLGMRGDFRADDIFIDQGAEAIIENHSFYPCRAKFRDGKINAFTHSIQGGNGVFLARCYGKTFTGTYDECLAWVKANERLPWLIREMAKGSQVILDDVVVQHSGPKPWRDAANPVPTPQVP
jgi:hypothetical protein